MRMEESRVAVTEPKKTDGSIPIWREKKDLDYGDRFRLSNEIYFIRFLFFFQKSQR